MFWAFSSSLCFNSFVSLWWRLSCWFTFHISTFGLKPRVLTGNTCFLIHNTHHLHLTLLWPTLFTPSSFSAATWRANDRQSTAPSSVVPDQPYLCPYHAHMSHSHTHIFSCHVKLSLVAMFIVSDMTSRLTILSISVVHKHSCVSPFGKPHSYFAEFKHKL